MFRDVVRRASRLARAGKMEEACAERGGQLE
jgi:hypothetical protein